MMGEGCDLGIIPNMCRQLFHTLKHRAPPAGVDQTYSRVEASFVEIYNETVSDLLGDLHGPPAGPSLALRVREHPDRGPYVDNLSWHAVESYRDVFRLLAAGNVARSVASTRMNKQSSRSHTLFTLAVTVTSVKRATAEATDSKSVVNLVDLAGSERAAKFGATGTRLKESQHINKSLSALGLVIAAVADAAGGKATAAQHVPYRNSLLTWLLKDSLGGNSFTTMLACCHSSPLHVDETLATLRWADRAKSITNAPVRRLCCLFVGRSPPPL